MKLFLKIALSDFENESRNKRELSVVSRFNMKIIVMAKGENNEIIAENGYEIHRRTTRPLTKHKLFIRFNRLCSIITWAFYARRLKPYCISCHDLVALLIGWFSTLMVPKKNKPLLVYDSHEFEIGRNTNGKRKKIATKIIPKLEKFLMNKCAFSIMVNDSIAREVHRIHNLTNMPVVVRNIPNYWNIDQNICHERKKEICTQLGMPIETFVVMYHGVVTKGRGIEILLKSIKENINIIGVILGNGDTNYIEYLKKIATELGVSDRVLFKNAVPIDTLWQYVGAADVGMITIPAVSESYYYMLPNKFFENIQSLTPVICSDFPEVSKIVNDYDIGLLVNPDNIDEIVASIEQMRTNSEVYSRFKSNLIQAKKELCWENESKVLEKAYAKILR